MKILVCVKQVPDLEGIRVNEGADGFVEPEFSGELRMNRFDEFAVEAAVRIKEAVPGVRIDAVTAGPRAADAVLRRAMGMGIDEGIHLLTPSVEDSIPPEPEAVAAWITGVAGSGDYRLILCGAMSEDGMHGMVGPMTAARMRLPYATQVIDMCLDPDRVSVEREIEGGAREMLDIRLPALLTLQPGINRPRYPSLSNLLRANRQPLNTVSVDTLVKSAVRMAPAGTVLPKNVRPSQVITGSSREKADALAAILKAKAFTPMLHKKDGESLEKDYEA
jgi:electron transfer flavoprotein beta subunit